MKKLTLFITVLFIIQTAISQDWLEFKAGPSTDTKCHVLASTDSIVEFEIDVPGMFSTDIDTFNRVQIKNHALMDSVGFPELPFVTYLAAIPECDSVFIQVELSDSILISDINIYPAPKLVADTTANRAVALVEQFEYNREFYESDTWFPCKVIETVDKGAIRAQQVVRVGLYPVKFNPLKKDIWAYSKAKVTLTFLNSTGSINQDVGIFSEVVGNTLINYESNGLNASVNCAVWDDTLSCDSFWVDALPNQKIDDPCDYLIIAPFELYDNQKLCDLANHRTSFNGFDVKIVTTDIIENNILPFDDDLEEKILKLIKNTYFSENANNTYDDKLAYVNLFGDVVMESTLVGIPTNFSPTNPNDGGWDVVYTQLTCDTTITTNDTIVAHDIYPDLMIGRCSVDTVTQVDNVVKKILNFVPEDLEYKYDMLTLATSDDFYETQSEVLMILDEILPDYYTKELMLDPGFDEPYPAWDSVPYGLQPFLDSLASGEMFVSYMDHGGGQVWGYPYFGYSNIDSSIYDSILPFILNAACLTGAFHEDWSSPYNNYEEDCMAEMFLSQDSIRGANGVVGATDTTAANFHLVSDYFESLLDNYAMVVGESMMEFKIKRSNYNYFVYEYNLFGDPALHILYENTDTVLPDLYIKDYQITYSPEFPIHGDTIELSAFVRNNLCNTVNDDFYVSCKTINNNTGDTLWIGNELLEGLDDFAEPVSFDWITDNISQYDYSFEVLFEIDTSNSIQEMNELNNMSYSALKIYSYNNGLYSNNIFTNNSHPVSFELNENYTGKEVVFGEKVISSSGDIISTDTNETKGFTSIGNLSNDEEYQILQVSFTDTTAYLNSIGDPEWSYAISDTCVDVRGPVITDLDNDGLEETLILELNFEYSETINESRLICIGNDGSKRWDYVFDNFITKCPLVYGGDSKTIVMASHDLVLGKIYFMQENATNDSVFIIDSIMLPNYQKMMYEPVISDLDKDDNPDLVYLSRLNSSIINVYDLVDTTHTSKTLEGLNNLKPILSDLDNDGKSEIIIGSYSNGILVLENDLDTLIYINEPKLSKSEIVSGDFNNDGYNDIVCQIEENTNEYYLKVYDYEGDTIFTSPIIPKLDACWISDINEDGENEIIYSYRNDMFVINVPNAGSSIGWPGQHGNFRNSGVLEHPAYFASNGDTVYWMNTISLVDSNAISTGSTVIIKPGTRIVANDSASLIVYGKLIAEGTKDFPITFCADINNSEPGYWQGITLKNHSAGSIENCIIKDAEIGVLFEDHNEVDITNCYIHNNIEGIGCESSSKIIKENIIVENSIGVAGYDGASPILCDLITESPYKNAIINNDTGIYIDKSTIYLDNGYNDIYCDSVDDEYYVINTSELKPYSIKARNNYWGTTIILNIIQHLVPQLAYDLTPVCSQPNTGGYKTSDLQLETLKLAFNAMNDEEYESADALFKQVIDSWSETDYSFLAISGLFSNNFRASGSWQNYEQYLNQLLQDSTYSNDFNKYIFNYQNLSLRERGEYVQAIANYESIILDNPAYNDSIYAVIDIGNTYLEAGNYKSSLGQLTYLMPASRAKHTEKTVDLLLSLKERKIKHKLTKPNDFGISEIFPNPFNGKTKVVYHIPDSRNIQLKVYDGVGRILQIENLGSKSGGTNEHTLNMQDFAPGVYFILIEADGINSSLKKIVLK